MHDVSSKKSRDLRRGDPTLTPHTHTPQTLTPQDIYPQDIYPPNYPPDNYPRDNYPLRQKPPATITPEYYIYILILIRCFQFYVYLKFLRHF